MAATQDQMKDYTQKVAKLLRRLADNLEKDNILLQEFTVENSKCPTGSSFDYLTLNLFLAGTNKVVSRVLGGHNAK
jgi:hypothetical protein